MITVAELKKRASLRYTDFLKQYYENQCKDYFPLVIPCNKGNPNDDFEKRIQELQAIHHDSKKNGKKSYTYDTEVTSCKSGKQTIIKQIYFENQLDFLSFIGKKNDFEVLGQVAQILFSCLHTSFNVDEIKEWLIKNHDKASNKNVEGGVTTFWKNICLCVNWLWENPNSNLYQRTIPLEVHSKFIEMNQALIHSLITKEKLTREKSFVRQHGLSDKPEFIRFRFLDSCTLCSGFSPTEMYITVDDFSKLSSAEFMKKITSIYVIENEMVYLTFPRVENAMCIWGHGFTAGFFNRFNWLQAYQLYYFGDLDEHGYLILSIFRESFPQTQSICMDMETLKAFDTFRVQGEKIKGDIPTNLTEEELTVFLELKKDSARNRLEQERVTQSWIEKAVWS